MADGYDYLVGEDGAPALALAGAAIIDPNTKSGNPAHEVGSGRFGSGPSSGHQKAQAKRKAQAAQAVPDTRPDVIRRRDAVVDAARTLSDLTPDGVRSFVQRRWSGTRVLQESDVEAFATDARRQRLDDLTDALDARLRRGVYGRSAKAIKVDFPRGFIRQTLRGLSDDEVQDVIGRLRVRGWTADEIRKHVARNFDDTDRRLSKFAGSAPSEPSPAPAD